MYRVNGLHLCVYIMDCTHVIVVTCLGVPTFSFKHWMVAQVFAYINNSMISKVYNCNYKFVYGIINFIFVYYFVFDHLNIFYYYYFPHVPLLLVCIFNCRLWRELTVILYHIHISLMFCYYVPWRHTYRFININGHCPSQWSTLPFVNNAKCTQFRM